MRRLIILTMFLGLAAVSANAQDTTKVTAGTGLFRYTCDCGCHNHPVNDYSGLNSLRARLANPGWDGSLKGISTGLKLEDGRIRPLSGFGGKADDSSTETSSSFSANENQPPVDPYLEEIGRGETPVGAPVYVFFRLAGTHVTDTPQLVGINAAADLAVSKGLRVRITGAADSATGSAEKNADIAKARAEHVAELMRKRGVPPERIEVLSEGGTAVYEPVAANRNCRIELFMR